MESQTIVTTTGQITEAVRKVAPEAIDRARRHGFWLGMGVATAASLIGRALNAWLG